MKETGFGHKKWWCRFFDGNIWSYLDSEDGLLNNNVHGITSDKIVLLLFT